MSGQRIGLLGGSFNPAHAGHRWISLEALKRLDLDAVWWLVSPQNPLKSRAEMAPLACRLTQARRLAAHPRIRVTDIEQRMGTVHTIDTLRRLRWRWPHRRFVWLMGADNLLDIPRWHNWQAIFATVPVAVFARQPYSRVALAGKAARRFSKVRVPPRRLRLLALMRPPVWSFVASREHPESASRIRHERQRQALATASPAEV